MNFCKNVQIDPLHQVIILCGLGEEQVPPENKIVLITRYKGKQYIEEIMYQDEETMIARFDSFSDETALFFFDTCVRKHAATETPHLN
jgi:hypothetical protein